ncbi:hypothetical protein AB0I68_38360 [Streptomyces sp. NPDC050448]|uniref:hypothetical protein n=1 Tax=Streptomyces sp. NPDC050448 TaxID=3155404 RepID=UPI0034388FAC
MRQRVVRIRVLVEPDEAVVRLAQLPHHPQARAEAADDWVDLARRSSSACEDIRAQGKKPLDDHWADATGKTAVSLVRNGGTEVTKSEALPGDVIFYEQVASDPSEPRGEIHHAAVVTSVTPDGDVKLSQHTSTPARPRT